MSAIKPLARKNNIVIQEFGDEILIYDLDANKAFNLNETSALIWQLSTGNNTISEIASKLSYKLNSPISEEFVWLALDQLQREKLVENHPQLFKNFNGNTRREIIKRVGLASLVAFPVISSLIFPHAVNAQSCPATNRPNGCPCTANGNCTSACCGASPDICVAAGSDAIGSVCRGNCECVNNCCGFGLVCAAVDSVAVGGACRVNCECIGASTCVGSVCV